MPQESFWKKPTRHQLPCNKTGISDDPRRGQKIDTKTGRAERSLSSTPGSLPPCLALQVNHAGGLQIATTPSLPRHVRALSSCVGRLQHETQLKSFRINFQEFTLLIRFPF